MQKNLINVAKETLISSTIVETTLKPTPWGTPYAGNIKDIIYIDDLSGNITKLEVSVGKSGNHWQTAHVATTADLIANDFGGIKANTKTQYWLFSKPMKFTQPALVRSNV